VGALLWYSAWTRAQRWHACLPQTLPKLPPAGCGQSRERLILPTERACACISPHCGLLGLALAALPPAAHPQWHPKFCMAGLQLAIKRPTPDPPPPIPSCLCAAARRGRAGPRRSQHGGLKNTHTRHRPHAQPSSHDANRPAPPTQRLMSRALHTAAAGGRVQNLTSAGCPCALLHHLARALWRRADRAVTGGINTLLKASVMKMVATATRANPWTVSIVLL